MYLTWVLDTTTNAVQGTMEIYGGKLVSHTLLLKTNSYATPSWSKNVPSCQIKIKQMNKLSMKGENACVLPCRRHRAGGTARCLLLPRLEAVSQGLNVSIKSWFWRRHNPVLVGVSISKLTHPCACKYS